MRSAIASISTCVLALACGGGAREEAFDKGTERKAAPEQPASAVPKVEPTPELDGLVKEEPVYLYSAEQDTVACGGSVRKGETLSYRVALFDGRGEKKGEQVELRPNERDYPARRKPLDEQLRTGFVALARTAWPAHGRELAIPGGDKAVKWTDDGALAVVAKGKAIHTRTLSRKDLIPVAIHAGPSFVAVQVAFDPKDKSTADASYSECVVLPTG